MKKLNQSRSSPGSRDLCGDQVGAFQWNAPIQHYEFRPGVYCRKAGESETKIAETTVQRENVYISRGGASLEGRCSQGMLFFKLANFSGPDDDRSMKNSWIL